MNNSKLNLLHIFFNLLIIKDSYQINYKKVCSKLLWQYGKLQCQNQHRVFKMFKTSHLGIIKMNYNCLSKEWRYKICLLHVFITKIIKPVMKFIITDHCNEIMQYPLSMKVDVDILFYKISSVKIMYQQMKMLLLQVNPVKCHTSSLHWQVLFDSWQAVFEIHRFPSTEPVQSSTTLPLPLTAGYINWVDWSSLAMNSCDKICVSYTVTIVAQTVCTCTEVCSTQRVKFNLSRAWQLQVQETIFTNKWSDHSHNICNSLLNTIKPLPKPTCPNPKQWD
jgi:hypothetical protein